MGIKKYIQFIKEADDSDLKDLTTDSNKFSEIKDEIKSMIEKTIERSGGEYSEFLDKLVKNPEDTKVEGLINDSDIYDFYLKWRNDIDEVLNDVNFFDDAPTEINAFGLYEFTIKGTERAVNEVIKML